jgi:hypothetical protein
MNREQDAIELLLSGNALMDLRALVRNAPRERSLHAVFEFLEASAEYIAKVEAFLRGLEPVIGTPVVPRRELAGVGAPSLRVTDDPSVCLSAPESPGLGGRGHGTIDGRWCVYCGAFKTHAGWRRPAAAPRLAAASQKGDPNPDPSSPAKN